VASIVDDDHTRGPADRRSIRRLRLPSILARRLRFSESWKLNLHFRLASSSSIFRSDIWGHRRDDKRRTRVHR
jgi:hypothetical protein